VSVRVLVVDDHAVVRAGLRLLLDAEDDIEPVGEAGSARDAIFQNRSVKPDVILLDVVMPGESGLDVIPTLLHERPEAKVLVLSMQDDPQYVRQAFAAGANGYVLKEAVDAEVVAAVREVAKGGRYVHPELGARLVAAETEAARRAEEDPLSDREREVLRLLALGHTNQEIAKQLYISVRTAETHRAHIMQKLRLSSRAELVRHALAQGLLEESAPEGARRRLVIETRARGSFVVVEGYETEHQRAARVEREAADARAREMRAAEQQRQRVSELIPRTLV
jgi:two-component system response regulator NreC